RAETGRRPMIRINLLAVERERTKKKKKTTRVAISATQRVTIGATVILLATVVGLFWWFWSLRQLSVKLDGDIARAEVETRQLRTVLTQVQKFEARKGQLQQRVTLIEQLRKGQWAPVRVLDDISRSVPERLWLTDMTQTGSDYTLNGFATTMTALTDFMAGVESTKRVKKTVGIIQSQVTNEPQNRELVKFVIQTT